MQLFVVSQSADFFLLLLVQYQLFRLPVSHGNTRVRHCSHPLQVPTSRVLYLNTILNPRLFNPNSLKNIKMPYSLPMQIKLRDTHTYNSSMPRIRYPDTISTQLSAKLPNAMHSDRRTWRTCRNSVTLGTYQSNLSGIMGSTRYFQYLPPVANGIKPPKVPSIVVQQPYLQSGYQTVRPSVSNAPISVSKELIMLLSSSTSQVSVYWVALTTNIQTDI